MTLEQAIQQLRCVGHAMSTADGSVEFTDIRTAAPEDDRGGGAVAAAASATATSVNNVQLEVSDGSAAESTTSYDTAESFLLSVVDGKQKSSAAAAASDESAPISGAPPKKRTCLCCLLQQKGYRFANADEDEARVLRIVALGCVRGGWTTRSQRSCSEKGLRTGGRHSRTHSPAAVTNSLTASPTAL